MYSLLNNKKLQVAFLVFTSLLIFLGRQLDTGITNFDDAYYAQKAKEMLGSGSFWLITHEGLPTFDNTPLTLWLTVLSYSVFGVSSYSAIVPSALFATGIIFMTYRLSLFLYKDCWIAFASAFVLLFPGKLVVAENPEDLPQLDELLLRGKNNNVVLHDITEKEAKEIEPRVKTFGRALFSPTTSSVDPSQVMQALIREALNIGIQIENRTRFLKKNKQIIETNRGNYEPKYVVNVGGLYADIIAKQFGFSRNYCILPFKGLYLYSEEPPKSLKTNIYPVPNLKNPFLGVHFSVTANGMSKIGPTAIPAFWREQYTGINNFNFNEFTELSLRQALLFFNSNFDFKQLAWQEIRKYSRSHLVKLASLLLKDVKLSNFKNWGKPGIRAQLLNSKTNTLEMDFIIEGDHQSIHVLNAVSPAFTCAFPFADFVCNKIEQLIN